MLFTDLVGSTEMVARLGEERAEELRHAHFAALREGIREHGGTEVKNLGDGLMVAFDSASDGVACAVAMQHALQRQSRRVGEPMAMRVGVGAGEATQEASAWIHRVGVGWGGAEGGGIRERCLRAKEDAVVDSA